MKNRYLVAFLSLIIFVGTALRPSVLVASEINNGYADFENAILNDDFTVNNEVEEFFLPALAIPVGSAFGYLMGAFGVVAGSALVYDNKEKIADFYNGEVEKFKLKCTALGLGATLVEDWLGDLASGVVRKSSDVYLAFKEFMYSSSVISKPVVPPATPDETYPDLPLYRGTMESGVFYNLIPDIKGRGETNYLTARIRFKESTTYEFDGNSPVIIAYRYSSSAYCFVVFATSRVNVTVQQSINELNSTSGSSGDLSLSKTINGVKYYYTEAIYGSEYGAIPFYDKLSFLEALKEYLSVSGEVDDVVFGKVGVIENVTNADIVGPTLAGTSDVVINWEDFDWESILQGLGKGEVSWSDALAPGKVGVIENDVVIGGVVSDEVVEVPKDEVQDKVEVTFPEVELGSTSNYLVDLKHLFPFCLPFDFVDFISLLSADPVAPHFDYKMPLPCNINGGSYTFTLDLTPFDSVAKLLRNMECIAFIIGLIFITREKMIRG